MHIHTLHLMHAALAVFCFGFEYDDITYFFITMSSYLASVASQLHHQAAAETRTTTKPLSFFLVGCMNPSFSFYFIKDHLLMLYLS